MGEETFQLHDATPTYARLLLTKPDKDKLNKNFFPC